MKRYWYYLNNNFSKIIPLIGYTENDNDFLLLNNGKIIKHVCLTEKTYCPKETINRIIINLESRDLIDWKTILHPENLI